MAFCLVQTAPILLVHAVVFLMDNVCVIFVSLGVYGVWVHSLVGLVRYSSCVGEGAVTSALGLEKKAVLLEVLITVTCHLSDPSGPDICWVSENVG